MAGAGDPNAEFVAIAKARTAALKEIYENLGMQWPPRSAQIPQPPPPPPDPLDELRELTDALAQSPDDPALQQLVKSHLRRLTSGR